MVLKIDKIVFIVLANKGVVLRLVGTLAEEGGKGGGEGRGGEGITVKEIVWYLIW